MVNYLDKIEFWRKKAKEILVFSSILIMFFFLFDINANHLFSRRFCLLLSRPHLPR